MKKTFLCLILIVVVSTCCVTNAMAVPKITGVQGGYGVSATVENATGCNWVISLWGSQIVIGMLTDGDISSDYVTIRTPTFPPAFGIGRINIRVTIYWTLIPIAIEERSAVMLGPFVLLVH